MLSFCRVDPNTSEYFLYKIFGSISSISFSKWGITDFGRLAILLPCGVDCQSLNSLRHIFWEVLKHPHLAVVEDERSGEREPQMLYSAHNILTRQLMYELWLSSIITFFPTCFLKMGSKFNSIVTCRSWSSLYPLRVNIFCFEAQVNWVQLLTHTPILRLTFNEIFN